MNYLTFEDRRERMDAVDLKILGLLEADARLSFAELSDRLQMSKKWAHR